MHQEHPEAHAETPPPRLSSNPISFVGWIITLVTATIWVVLFVAGLTLFAHNPYNDLVTYLILPGFLVVGLAILFLGVALEWRRRHQQKPSQYPRLPMVDLNQPWQRRRLILGTLAMALFFTVSTLGTYRAYHFTESPEFCGMVCHTVMEPEYTAYQYSHHARVACTECHIGSGADWYVKSKMSGLRQVWAVATNSYSLPIDTPVHNLRPARGTCEECHWPEKFSDSVERTIWHFSPDRANTALRYNLLMKVGGGAAEAGLGRGIHWHISPGVKVWYWARDEDRLDIPWVKVESEGGETRVYRTPDAPEAPPEDELRLMDCIDCHNRPSHVYRSPRQVIDFYMSTGLLDASLPYLKRHATGLYEARYETTEAALAAIDEKLRAEYATMMESPRGEELILKNIEWLQTLYQRNFFPEQGVDWRAYPNHQGHFEWPGCYRCHDDQHASDAPEAGVLPGISQKARVISNDCQLCHIMLDQAEGMAAYEPIQYQGGDYQHPRNLGDIWRERNCTDCHGVEALSEGEATAEVAAR